MNWCFAIINNKLAEVFFEKKKNGKPEFQNHCYVKKEDYKTKQEQKWIEKDTKKVKLVYRKGEYKLLK